MNLIVGMTGASGAIIGVRTLQALQALEVETHLVLTPWGRALVEYETSYTVQDLREMADHVHGPADQAAAISSGSYPTDGMIIAPCSMKTLAAIRAGYAEDLVVRAADVTLKERRKLVLVPCEAPLNEIHLENMLALARMGALILPPMPAFYNHPETIDDIVMHLVARIFDHFGLELPSAFRWKGGLSRPRVEPATDPITEGHSDAPA
ncbi:UbiX family flavin prenyltransferase [Streptomyces telluris]|uniref:Flavin prenyltransferase UbiX n=1 Tax=Streptomyces telluris TaxID=2720021 RepID=A0A9X2LMB2_9ACTN|nr:UbiX family flavin prenyltransferase [Streptomyces telluris]MCQ8773574.1 UbiX family flavin prenyltransferase [Streptomyces telluris]